MGWGKERFDSPSYQQILRDVEMPIVPNDICQKKLRSAALGSSFNLHESFNCAGYVLFIRFSTKGPLAFLKRTWNIISEKLNFNDILIILSTL